MKIEISMKKKSILIGFLIGLYSSFGIGLDITKLDPSKTLKRFEVSNFWTNLYANMMISMKNTGYTAIIFALLAIIICFMYLMVLNKKYKIREILPTFLISSIYALSIWLGIVFTHKESWHDFLSNKFRFLKSFLFISGWILLLIPIILLLVSLVNKSTGEESVKESFGKKELIKLFAFIALMLIVLWMPVYLIFQPGMMHGDVPMQILQYYHIPTFFQGRWVSDGVKVVFTNDHPFMHTMILGKALDFGLKIGNLKMALRLLTTVQALLYIIGFAGIISSLFFFGVKRKYLLVATLIYGLVPIFPMYALNYCGDSFMTLFFLFFILEMIWICQTRGEVLNRKRFVFSTFVTILLFCMAKNQGMYIAVVTILFIFIFYRKYWKSLVICMILPLFVFNIAYKGFVFDAYHVQDVGKQEALSFFFQQTARTVKYHKDSITEEEKESIDKVLDYEIIADKYDPNLADGVKKTYREDAKSEDLSRYFSTWFHMAFKYPVEYLQSAFASTWKYYSPLSTDVNIYYPGATTIQKYATTRAFWTKGVVPQEFIEKMDWNISKANKTRRNIAYYYLLMTKYIPVMNWFVLPGCISWLMLLSFLLMWIRKNYRAMLMYLPVFLVLGVCLLSPVNGNVRYLLPVYTMVPVMLATALGGKKEK